MATSRVSVPLLQLLLLLLSFYSFASSDLVKDRAECTDQLIGLAPCMSFIMGGGDSKSPTPDCCSSLKTVVDKSMKCLCILVHDRNDPNLGIKYNLTSVLRLPSKCHLPIDVTKCPRLLNLPTNSTDTKDFEQLADEIKGFVAAGGNGSKLNARSATNGNVAPLTNTSNESSKRMLGITMESGAWIFSIFILSLY